MMLIICRFRLFLRKEVNRIIIGEQQSTGLIKGVSLGILAPGETASKTLLLASTGTNGDRMVDISVQSRTAPLSSPISRPGSPSGPDALETSSTENNEILQTLEIPIIAPFIFKQQMVYMRKDGALNALSDLTTFDKEFWDDSQGGRVVVSSTLECVDCAGAAGIVIESIELVKEVTSFGKRSIAHLLNIFIFISE